MGVDEASGNVFGYEGNPSKRLDIFGAEGDAPAALITPFTISGLAGGNANTQVAVDNSSGVAAGTVYLAESKATLKKFALDTSTGRYEADGELTASPPFSSPSVTGVAVGPSGSVFVADRVREATGVTLAGAIVEFGAAGAQVGELATTAAVGSPFFLAVDGSGDLFVANVAGQVFEYQANPSGEIERCGADADEACSAPIEVAGVTGATGVAVDAGTETLFIAVGDRVLEYDARTLTREGEFGAGTLDASTRVAVNSDSNRVYVADNGSPKQIRVFGPAITVPTPTTGAASEVTTTGATLGGTVDPEGTAVEECFFEYGPTTAYGEVSPCVDPDAGEVGSGTGAVAVHAAASALSPGTAYSFRLVVKANGVAVHGSDAEFETNGPPRVEGESFSALTKGEATVSASIDPVGEPTHYYVEYVSDAEFGIGGWAGASRVPSPPEGVGAGHGAVAVAQRLTGLLAGTTYHFRFVAENPAGPAVDGQGGVFRTYGAGAGLPDGRAYEQVTPPDKGAASAQAYPNTAEVAGDGSAVSYVGNSGFPNTLGVNAIPSFIASRGQQDWTSAGMSLPAGEFGESLVIGWDVGQHEAFVRSSVGGVRRLIAYRPAAGRTAVISQVALPLLNAEVAYGGSSDDGEVALFESSAPLVSGAPEQSVYVWDRATNSLHVASLLNDGTPLVEGAFMGPYDYFFGQTTERGGGSFPSGEVKESHALSDSGHSVVFTERWSGQLYVRVNPDSDQSAMSGGECTEPEKACTLHVSERQAAGSDPNGPMPAAFMGATKDGQKIFFTSHGALTPDANTGEFDEGNDLYEYDVATRQLTDLTPLPGAGNGAEVQGVLAIGGEGSYVYFAANGVLASGGVDGNCVSPVIGSSFPWVSGTCNLYVQHDGQTRFIGELDTGGGLIEEATQQLSDAADWQGGSSNPAQRGRTARISADGEVLLFRSRLSLTEYDSGGVPEFYRYDYADGSLLCVSCNPTGLAPIGRASLQDARPTNFELRAPSILPRNLSSDGDRVFFESPDALVGGDVNGAGGCAEIPATNVFPCQDVYEWEAPGEGSCAEASPAYGPRGGGCLFLLSTGESDQPSYFVGASADGSDAFLLTAQRLVGQDRDEALDIYDARVGGGIASQNPPSRAECREEGCRSAAVAPPTAGGVATTAPGSEGNVEQKHHKKKHHKKKHHKKKGQNR